MSENINEIKEKTHMTVYISVETKAFIEARAAQERRKPSSMASLMLEDLAKAQNQ